MNGVGGGIRPRWKTTKPSKPSLFCFSLLLLFFFFFFFFFYIQNILPQSAIFTSSKLPQTQCSAAFGSVQKFLWYAPHSGFSNQLSEFKHAIVMAAILNRTLIVPPVLDHHAVVLGSCPKFRVLPPNQLRLEVWNHAIDLYSQGRLVIYFKVIYIYN